VQTNKRPSFLAHVKTPSYIWKKSQKGMFEISQEDLLTCICYSLYRCCQQQFLSPTKEINQLNEGEEKPHSCKDVMFASISLASAYKGGTSRNYHVIKASFLIYIYIK
jgi:hypothetical protein